MLFHMSNMTLHLFDIYCIICTLSFRKQKLHFDDPFYDPEAMLTMF